MDKSVFCVRVQVIGRSLLGRSCCAEKQNALIAYILETYTSISQ